MRESMQVRTANPLAAAGTGNGFASFLLGIFFFVRFCRQTGNFSKDLAQNASRILKLKNTRLDFVRLVIELVAERAQAIQKMIVLERKMHRYGGMIFTQREIRRQGRQKLSVGRAVSKQFQSYRTHIRIPL